MIQCYQMRQCLNSAMGLLKNYHKGLIIDDVYTEYRKNRYYKLNEFLKDFVSTLENNILLFCYGKGISGHAILAVGYTKMDNGDYVVELYDLNSVGPDDEKGYFETMIIKSDFSEIFFQNDEITMDNFLYLEFEKVDDIDIINPLGINFEETSTDESFLEGNDDVIGFRFKNNSSFSIRNSKNEVLNYDGEKFSGDIEVIDLNPIVYGNDSTEMQITIPYDEQITYTANSANTDFYVYDNNNFVSVKGENLSNATIDFDEYVKVEGENSNVRVQMDNVNEGLYEVNTKIAKDILLTRENDDITITSEQNLEGVEIEELTPEEKKTLANEINAKNIKIDKEGNVIVIDNKKVEEISISKIPEKVKYTYLKDDLDVTGGEIKVKYDDATEETIEITKEMVTGFDNTKLGKETLTVTYGEKTATYEIEIVEDNTNIEGENSERTNNLNNNNQSTEKTDNSNTNEENKNSMEETSKTPTTGDRIEIAIMLLFMMIFGLCAAYVIERKL